MKGVVILGARGQLGSELLRLDNFLTPLDRDSLDIRYPDQIASVLEQAQPECVINCAAYTAVDRAESDIEQAMSVNAEGVQALAQYCSRNHIRLIHVSTDFVFNGESSKPYLPDDKTDPVSVYGRSKRMGEEAIVAAGGNHLIIRTAWLYAAGGNNFLGTMLRLMRERDIISVVADQIGTPTVCSGLAKTMLALCLRNDVNGYAHWTDAGVASWYDFAVAIHEIALELKLIEKPIMIQPIRSADYPTPAKRPFYSVLDKTRLWQEMEAAPIHWREALKEEMSRRRDVLLLQLQGS